MLRVFNLPLLHPLAHFSSGGETINIEVRRPEELAEILRTLQLHLYVLHIFVEILDQDSAALIVLLEELFELIYMILCGPACVIFRGLFVGTCSVGSRPPLKGVFSRRVRLGGSDAPEGDLRILWSEHLFLLVPDHRERVLVLAHEVPLIAHFASVVIQRCAARRDSSTVANFPDLDGATAIGSVVFEFILKLYAHRMA